MKKRLLSLLLAGVMVLTAPASLAESQYKVGICQILTHEAVEQAAQGFMDALDEALGKGTVSYDMKDASGDSSICTLIVNDFIYDEVDLILANGTPALQAAAASTGDIPILGTSVTEYGVALGIDDFNGLVGGNVSGTSDLAPMDQQAQMIPDLFPEARTVGLLYCSAEPNSLYQIETVKACLEGMNLTAIPYPFTDSNDMAAVTQEACLNVDVIYIPTDNTVAANATIVDNLCQPAGIPVVTGDTGTCAVAGAAVLGISYYELGQVTGRMAADILTGKAEISTMPIAYAENVTHQYNPLICEALGISVPDSYVPLNIQ
ncbi:MAG: ABC transporter substrate-binding protein [Clostridia bacterium]|nr:ABC transporter substrate-binding protein [Clostridia bacterium]